ncbi:hypothetical protein ACROYT_G017194 [Oculina patagonica]
MSGKRKWADFKEKTSKKRMGKREDGMPTDYITVQRLSSSVEGGCAEIFPDLLAGERGPSYTDASQIKNWKLVHIRFIENVNTGMDRSSVILPGRSTRVVANSSPASPQKASQLKAACTVATSVPLSQMLKLGRLILPKFEVVKLHLEEFSISKREWQQPIEVTLSLDKSSFASGGFRDAYIATSMSGLPPGKYVLKKYREDRIADIEKLFVSTEAHNRKAVQMNALARNFAQIMETDKPALEFGKSFTYTKVYYSVLNGEFVTVENFLDGTFQKMQLCRQ